MPDEREHDEPDYRFTLANERTYLAWMRTALAFVAGGLAVGAIDTDLDPRTGDLLRVICLVVAAAIAGYSYRRWAVVQDAMKTGSPLPAHPLLRPIALAIVIACAGIGLSLLL